MGWRLVGTVGRVKVHYDSDIKEYRVREPARLGGGVTSGTDRGYFTNDRQDAFNTARDMAQRSQSYYGNPRRIGDIKRNPRPKRGRIAAVRSDFFVSVWEERDRLHIALKVGKKGEHETEVLEWWDDDARQMFEDGFFDARHLEDSVVKYAEEIGHIEVL